MLLYNKSLIFFTCKFADLDISHAFELCQFWFLGCRWLKAAENHSMLLSTRMRRVSMPRSLSINASEGTGHISLLFTFHWPKQVTLPGINLRAWGSEVSHNKEIKEKLTLVNAYNTIKSWIANVRGFMNNVQNADF